MVNNSTNINNCLGAEMVSVLASSFGLSAGGVKPKTIELVFGASPPSTQH
jgi:hypothetical protein